MIKIRYLTLFCLFFACSAMSAVASARSLPTEEQVSKLVVSLWKECPDSIDAMVYTTLTSPPEPEDEIRRSIKDFFWKIEGNIISRQDPNSEYIKSLNMEVEQNVKRILRQQQYPRRIKEHVRISGSRERIDQAIAYEPGMELKPDTPYEHTYVKGDPEKDDFGSFRCDHFVKAVYVSDKKMWKESGIKELTGLPWYTRLWFRSLLGVKDETKAGLNFIPDGEKLQKLRSGELEAFTMMISAEQDNDPNLPKDRIELFSKNGDEPPAMIILCDRNDYSRVYYFESRNPFTGELIFVRRCSNFNFEGFPRNATIIWYDENGEEKKKKEITISNLKLNSSLPDDLFAFNPPEGYKVVDNRTKKQ
jgi:hypothetical protein